jgi:hydroxymethylbilane synthase
MGRESRVFRVGTRGSRLAQWQADRVVAGLEEPSEKKIVRTTGDRDRTSSLQGQSESGFFTREIENLLLHNAIDLAVHSLKDMPTDGPEGLEIAAVLERGPVADLLLIHPDWYDADCALGLRDNCRVGTGSLRRQALLSLYAPQSHAELMRGNVPTRVGRCKAGEFGALVLARAGVERLRLALSPLVARELDPVVWIPAPAQGAVAVQIRADDRVTRRAVEAIDHSTTHMAALVERALMARAGGGCHAPFGAFAWETAGGWHVVWGLADGEGRWMRGEATGAFEECRDQDPAHAVLVAASEEIAKPYGTAT